MKRFINFWKYTHSIGFMFRIIFAGIFVKLANVFGEKMLKIANKFCDKEYVFNTPFGKYLGKSLQDYLLMDENFEPEIGKIAKNKSNSNDKKILINIGCNIGRRTIDLAKNYGYDVIAFEPAPNTFYSLNVNVALSNLIDNVTTYNYALGNENTSLNFEYREYHNGSSHIIDGNDVSFEGGDIIKVPVKKFDDLGFGNDIIENIRLMIIDVEGFEFEVLKGMGKTLSSLKDVDIICEIWEGKKDKDDILKYMSELGYKSNKICDGDWKFSKK